jgi:Flp pilus assembly protein TadD
MTRPTQISHLGNWKKIFRGSLGYSHYIFAVVFLVRLIVLARLTSSPSLLPSGSDMQFYDDWAKQVLHGHWTDHRAFYGLPLYPFLLALLYRFFGDSFFAPGFCQACFDAGTAVLIYKIAIHVVVGRDGATRPGGVTNSGAAKLIGIFADAGWCFFVPAQAYSAILMPTAGAAFVVWLLVWQIVRKPDATLGWCFGCGLLLGIAAMGVASILFLAPLFVAAIFLRTPTRRRPAGVALLVAGVIAGTAPCWIHNYVVARDPVFLSAHGGVNLWLGNNPDATGYPSFPGLHSGQGQMLRESIEQAEAAAGHPLKRSEVSRYWSEKARNFIVSNPGSWSKLLARKFGNFWNAFEYDDLGVIVNLRKNGVLLPGFHFGLLAALGLAGAIFSWRTFPISRWVVAAVALQTAAILPVFVTERYRLPVVPGLLVLAALGLYQLWNLIATANYAVGALQLCVVASSALFVAIPRHDPSLWALEAYNAGRFALETNDLAAAERHLQRARALVPDNAETSFALGNLRFAQNNLPAARDFYEAVLKIEAKHKGALNNLGVIALNQNDGGRAVDFFRRSLAIEPRNAKTHYLLARALELTGNHDEAQIEAGRALELDPSQPEFKALQEQLTQK